MMGNQGRSPGSPQSLLRLLSGARPPDESEEDRESGTPGLVSQSAAAAGAIKRQPAATVGV